MKAKIQLNSVNGDSIVLKQFEIHEDFVSVYLNALNEIRENYECPSLADDDLARQNTFTLELVKVNGDGEVEEWNVSDFSVEEVRDLDKDELCLKLSLKGKSFFWVESQHFYADDVDSIILNLDASGGIRKGFPVAVFRKLINGEKEFVAWVYGRVFDSHLFNYHVFEKENILEDLDGNFIITCEDANKIEGTFTLGDYDFSWCPPSEVVNDDELMRLVGNNWSEQEIKDIILRYTDANKDVVKFLFEAMAQKDRMKILNACDQVVLMDNEEFIYLFLEEVDPEEESGHEFLGKEYRLR